MEGNMKYYVDVWFVLMCVTLILIPVASHFKKNSLTLLAGANVIGMISMIIWATTPHYYNMEVEAIYSSLLIFFTMFFGVKEKFNLDDVALLILCVCIICCTILLFSKENYKQWKESLNNFHITNKGFVLNKCINWETNEIENCLKLLNDCSLKKLPIKIIIKGIAIFGLEYELTKILIDFNTSLSAKLTLDKTRKN